MSDLFSNLAALNLGSEVGVQPLVPPLFAPAPQLFSETVLPAFNDHLAEAEDNAIFSITPSIVVGGTGTEKMELPSDEVVTPEKRTMPSDLVPADVPQHTIATYLPINSTKDKTTRSSSMYRLPGEIDGASMAQPLQPQEFAMPSTGNPEITSSSVLHEEKKHNAEKLSPPAPSDYETQQASQQDHPVIPTVEAFHVQNLSTPSDKVVSPLPIRQALPVSIPLLPGDDLSEHGGNRESIFDKKSSSSMQPQIQSSSNPVHIEEFIAPDQEVSESASNAARSQRRATAGEPPEAISQPRSELYEHAIKPLLYQNTVAKEREELQSPFTAATSEGFAQYEKARLEIPTASETVHSISPVHPSNAEDALHSSRVASKDEPYRAKAESEVSPINITIGRVVVRATQAAQPTPIKKRVLRPAQSLDEYLKQRERGSR